jgi:hypothetical protein
MTWHISIGRKQGYTGSRRGRNHRRSGWWDFLCSSSINTQGPTFARRTKSRTKRLTVRRAGEACRCADRGWIWPRLLLQGPRAGLPALAGRAIVLAGHATACAGAPSSTDGTENRGRGDRLAGISPGPWGRGCRCSRLGAGHDQAAGARAAKRPRALPDTGTPRHSAASRGERARSRSDPDNRAPRRGRARPQARPSAATAWALRAPSRAGIRSLAG